MNLVVVVGVLAAVVVIAAVVLIAVTRRPKDAVDSFRRQIDALSPEARRGVVDQVQHAAGRGDAPADSPESSEVADEAGDGGDEDGGDGGDGDGARGA